MDIMIPIFFVIEDQIMVLKMQHKIKIKFFHIIFGLHPTKPQRFLLLVSFLVNFENVTIQTPTTCMLENTIQLMIIWATSHTVRIQ